MSLLLLLALALCSGVASAVDCSAENAGWHEHCNFRGTGVTGRTAHDGMPVCECVPGFGGPFCEVRFPLAAVRKTESAAAGRHPAWPGASSAPGKAIKQQPLHRTAAGPAPPPPMVAGGRQSPELSGW